MNDVQLTKVMGSPRLPTLPKVAFRIVQLMESPDVKVAELSATIGADPALTAKILKTANSGLYGRVRGVGKLQEAVMVLGLRNVKTLALGFSLVTDLSGPEQGGLEYTAFWRRSLIAACAARAASARAEAGRHGDEAFLGGLLHGIGMVALDRALGAAYAGIAALLPEGFGRVLAREEAELGLSHTAVATALGKSWNLPPSLIASLEHYATPAQAPEEFRMTVLCVALGAQCADLASAMVSPRVSIGFREASKALGLPDVDAEGIFSEALTEAAVLISTFEGAGAEGIVPADILARAHEALLEISLGLVRETTRLESERTVLFEEATVDALTGVSNRRRFDDVLEKQSETFSRDRAVYCVLMIDVDFFKRVNDDHGHAAGDKVLQQLAAVVRSTVRATDFVGRYGGEEFVVILPRTDRSRARMLAERIRAAVAVTPMVIAPGKVLHVTVSIGLADAGEAGREAGAALLKAADTALYAAKHEGRNAVRAA